LSQKEFQRFPVNKLPTQNANKVTLYRLG
jgi:hypothetical protein